MKSYNIRLYNTRLGFTITEQKAPRTPADLAVTEVADVDGVIYQ